MGWHQFKKTIWLAEFFLYKILLNTYLNCLYLSHSLLRCSSHQGRLVGNSESFSHPSEAGIQHPSQGCHFSFDLKPPSLEKGADHLALQSSPQLICPCYSCSTGWLFQVGQRDWIYFFFFKLTCSADVSFLDNIFLLSKLLSQFHVIRDVIHNRILQQKINKCINTMCEFDQPHYYLRQFTVVWLCIFKF